MRYEGVLTKMSTEITETVQYYLIFESDFIKMNQLLDKRLSINFLRFQCLNCKLQKKIFAQGYCYNCFTTIPQAGEWIRSPELSKAHLGIEDRDLEFEKECQDRKSTRLNSSHVKIS